jgi:hypothetical protein
MRFVIVLSLGLLLVSASWTPALPLSAGSCDASGPASLGFLRALIHAPFLPSLPRPSVRDDLVETLTFEEEEEGFPATDVSGAPSPTSLVFSQIPLDGLLSAPQQAESGSLRQRPSSLLRC